MSRVASERVSSNLPPSFAPTEMSQSVVSMRGPVSFCRLRSPTLISTSRGLDAGSDRLAIALQGMTVAEKPQAARMIHGQQYRCAFADHVVVEIAAPVA